MEAHYVDLDTGDVYVGGFDTPFVDKAYAQEVRVMALDDGSVYISRPTPRRRLGYVLWRQGS